MDEENKEKKDCACVTPPEEYTALKMATDTIDKLLKIIKAMFIGGCLVVTLIVAGFLVYNHFTVSQITETTTLTTEAEINAAINDSTVTTYPNTNTSKNVSTNK